MFEHRAPLAQWRWSDGMKDLVNYVCAALIYKERMHSEDTIRKLLQSVEEGSLSFSEALEEFP